MSPVGSLPKISNGKISSVTWQRETSKQKYTWKHGLNTGLKVLLSIAIFSRGNVWKGMEWVQFFLQRYVGHQYSSHWGRGEAYSLQGQDKIMFQAVLASKPGEGEWQLSSQQDKHGDLGWACLESQSGGSLTTFSSHSGSRWTLLS